MVLFFGSYWFSWWFFNFVISVTHNWLIAYRNRPPKGVLRKRCSENTQQIYRRTLMTTCDFSKVERIQISEIDSLPLTFIHDWQTIWVRYIFVLLSPSVLRFLSYPQEPPLRCWCLSHVIMTPYILYALLVDVIWSSEQY